MSMPPDAVRAGERGRAARSAQAAASASPSIATGTPSSNPISTTCGAASARSGVIVSANALLGRRRPGILERAGLDRAAPQVLVDGVRRAGLDRHLDAVLRRRRRSPARASCPSRAPAPAPPGRAPAPPRRSRSAPGRCPCRCSRGPPRWRRARGPRPPGAWRSAAATAPRPAGSGPRRARRPAAIGSTYSSANSSRASTITTSAAPAWQRARSDCSASMPWPTSTSRAITSARVLVGQPAQGDGGVEAARVGEDDGVLHVWCSFFSRSMSVIRSCPVCGSRATSAIVSSPAMVPMISGR